MPVGYRRPATAYKLAGGGFRKNDPFSPKMTPKMTENRVKYSIFTQLQTLLKF